MQQNAALQGWSFEVVEKKLEAIMSDIHSTCLTTAEELGEPGNYLFGANAAGFMKVADAMIHQGVV